MLVTGMVLAPLKSCLEKLMSMLKASFGRLQAPPPRVLQPSFVHSTVHVKVLLNSSCIVTKTKISALGSFWLTKEVCNSQGIFKKYVWAIHALSIRDGERECNF
jgi:hypothetical protein